MREGFILLYRQGITAEEWKYPRRTLAWIDLLTMTDYSTGVVTASYGFLAKRWNVSKNTAFIWIKTFLTERQLERLTERNAERNAERFFVVNFAKYQKPTKRIAERGTERIAERGTEQIERSSSNNSLETINGVEEKTPSQEAIDFFTKDSDREPSIQKLIEFGVDESKAKAEVKKFCTYWTERNKSGTKQRWQTEPTFEVKLRLKTWMERSFTFSQPRK